MKNLLSIAVLLGATQLFSFNAMAGDINAPQLVNHFPQRTFIPVGFDDNDNVQIILDAAFPNTCYRTGPTKFSVDASKKIVHIRNQAYYFSEELCLMVIVPYMKTIDLGIVPEGNYQVLVDDYSGNALIAGKLNITKAKSSGPDDYLYAPIREVGLEQPLHSNPVLVLRGSYPSTCMKIVELRVNYDTPTIEVLPISEFTGVNCQNKEVPFEIKQVLTPAPGRTLIHVRSLNGQALNQVVTF